MKKHKMGKMNGEVAVYGTHRYSIEYKIKDCISKILESDEQYRSPSFHFCSGNWCLVISRSSRIEDNTVHLAILLKKLTSKKSNHMVHCEIVLNKMDEANCFTKECAMNFSETQVLLGWTHFIELSQLMNKIENDGTLTISCTLKTWASYCSTGLNMNTVSATDTIIPQKTSWRNLVDNMKDLFLMQINCDVIIKVKGQDIPAHRLILASRSPVFQAMFTHDMSENRTRIVEITDADPSSFHDFLLFLYCGQVDHISSHNMCDLYTLADKYALDELKKVCVPIMECHVTVETVLDIMLIAERHNEEHLIELSRTFIMKNAANVLCSDQFDNLQIENPMLTTHILKYLLLDMLPMFQ